jgi:hypothetical protein
MQPGLSVLMFARSTAISRRLQGGDQETHMGGASKTWPARMVASVMALALVLACAFGAYAHAAGHTRHLAPQAAPAQSAEVDGAWAGQEAGHDNGWRDLDGHDRDGHGKAGTGTDCCNAMCAGGHAILATSPAMPRPALGAPFVDPQAPLDSAVPRGLERPPKASLPA